MGDDAVERAPHQKGLDPHLDKTVRCRGSVVGVDRGKHEVPGQGCLDCDRGRLAVPYLPDEDDVGIRAQDRPQRRRKGEARFVVDLDLVYSVQLVLDRVLDGDHVLGGQVEDIESRVQGGRLTGASGAGDEYGAVRLVVGLLVPAHIGRVEAKLRQTQFGLVLVEDPLMIVETIADVLIAEEDVVVGTVIVEA